MRVLIHPGFHKTGTSSLQRGAIQCADQLAPHLRVMLTDDVRRATQIARRFAIHWLDQARRNFSKEFTTHICDLDPEDPRPVLISSEALIGQIPGRKDVWTYAAAVPLLDEMVRAFETQFEGRADVSIWFTTRQAEEWKRSAYWQNLRSDRLTQDFATYHEKLETGAQFDKVIETLQDWLGDRANVSSTAIEDCGKPPLGPLGKALEILDIPTQGLPALSFHNIQPDGAADHLLALNRSDMSDEELTIEKRRFMKSLWRQGKTKREVK